ncbi:MAG: hypothetical protein K5872_08770 [Rhizobiaceae bacterium]|nr:hypothetical protein [Rhizobiaceae bacterium]MCV0406307.1 hypothetical protein [Rhizobiaceae bacterium]
MNLNLAISDAAAAALRRFAAERDLDLDRAAELALRDWLMGNGYLELPIDEETEVEGEA